MSYKEAIKVWRAGNKEELMKKFYTKFTYSSLRLDGVNITYEDVEEVFAENKTDKVMNDYKTRRKSLKDYL